MSYHWPLWLARVSLLAIFLPLAAPSVVHAQVPTSPPESESCLACHADLYYLYDTGKWYCMVELPPTCIHCHAGQAGALTVEAAHVGLIANPLRDDAAVCRSCHADAYRTHVETFIARAGGHVTSRPAPTPPPPVPPSAGRASYQLPARLREPWRLAGLGLVAAALAALGLGEYRLYRADQKRHTPA